MDERKANYKKTLNKGETTKKRFESTSKLQKEKREKCISSKRSRRDHDEEESVFFSAEEVSLVLQQLQGKETGALRKLRKILSSEEPPIDQILQSPTQPIASLIHLLRNGDEVHQLDAAWCITNLATGTHEQTTAVLPTAPYLIQHLSGSNYALVEQCAWALGNISADCVEYRDVLRANGVINPLVSILQISLIYVRYALAPIVQRHPPQFYSLARTAAFALANQSRGQNPKVEEILTPTVASVLVRILELEGDNGDAMNDSEEVSLATEVLIEASWVLAYLTAQCPNPKLLGDAGLLPLLIRHLQSPLSALVIPILRTVGNIIARSDEMTDKFLTTSITPPLIPILRSLLFHNHRAIQKESTYVISNIAGGPQSHVDLLIHHEVVPALSLVLHSGQFDLSREAAYAVSNIASNAKYIEVVVAAGIVQSMLALLTSVDSEVAHLALTFVEMVLTFHPQGSSIIQQEDGIEKLEALQYHKNQELYILANQLVDTFFGEDFETDIEPEKDVSKIEYPSWRVKQM